MTSSPEKLDLFIVGDSYQYDGGMVPVGIYSSRAKAEEVAHYCQCVEQLFAALQVVIRWPERPTRAFWYLYSPHCHYEVVETPWYWNS
jgi:translation elongation factor EF-Tu-like GTPase